MDLYKNKYRISSTRLQNWDYGWNAAYFITICTNDRVCYFGKVVDGIMQLSDICQIAKNNWSAIPKHFPFVRLDEFVIMPNHVHGIVIIDKKYTSPQDITSPQSSRSPKIKFGPQSKNLASIIRGYKSSVTISARLINSKFGWQPLYHDHIIRNEKSFQNISEYIIHNPQKWHEDQLRKPITRNPNHENHYPCQTCKIKLGKYDAR